MAPAALAKSRSTPAVFQRPVIQELYQGRSNVESALDYRILPTDPYEYEFPGNLVDGAPATKVGQFDEPPFAVGVPGADVSMRRCDRSLMDITERHQAVVGATHPVVAERYERDVNRYAIGRPRDVTAYRDGITKDCEVQAADHVRLVKEAQREKEMHKAQRQMAQGLAGFIASQQLGLTKPAWTYTDAPGFFEASSSVGSIVDATPSENYEKNSLMGMWPTKGYRHCHQDANVFKPTTPGLMADKKLTHAEAMELYEEYMKKNVIGYKSGRSEKNTDREGWNYFKEFGDEYFGRWKGLDVDVDSKHPRHSFLHSVDQQRLRGQKEKHYDAKVTKTVKHMTEQRRQDAINLTTGWRRREKMLHDANDFSALASEDRKKNDWSAQDKTLDWFEQPIYNALTDEPYNGPHKHLITVPKRAVDFSATDFVCGESRAPGGVTGSFSDPRITVSRTMSGDFWLRPEELSTMNKSVPKTQKKFDYWNRSAKQYWAREAAREAKTKAAGGKSASKKVAPAEPEGPLTFALSRKPNRWCWSMRVHAGNEQQEIAVEADPQWTVDQFLRKLLGEATAHGLIPEHTVRSSVNTEDAVWSLLESKARGQSTTVDRTASLEIVGLEALKGSHLTRVGLAASLVSPLAEATDVKLLSTRTKSSPSLHTMMTRKTSKERLAEK